MDGGGIYIWILKFSVQKIMEEPEGGSEGWGLVETAGGGVLCLQDCGWEVKASHNMQRDHMVKGIFTEGGPLMDDL